ncbi:MAG: HEAT repeat domain-containing protein [bacterium]
MKNIINNKLFLVVISLILIYVLYFGFLPYFEGFPSKEISKILKLKSLDEKGVTEIHKILKNSYSLKVKEYAVYALKEIGDPSSIKILIDEFEYEGRWWVRWWDYEERYDVDAYHSTVARNLADIIEKTNKVNILYKELKNEDEDMRYWMLYTLSFIEEEIDLTIIENIVKNDPSEKVKKLAVWVKKNKK